MVDRILGVFRLSVNTFEEIEHDTNATSQAAIVVAIVALLAAVGSGFGASIAEGSFLNSFIGTLVWTFIGWFLWSLASWFVGTNLFKGTATIDEMLRVIGFAYAPQMLGIIPCIGWLIGLVWSLIAGFIAIRQGLDLDNMRALLTVIVGFILYALGSFLLSALLGGIGGFGLLGI